MGSPNEQVNIDEYTKLRNKLEKMEVALMTADLLVHAYWLWSKNNIALDTFKALTDRTILLYTDLRRDLAKTFRTN